MRCILVIECLTALLLLQIRSIPYRNHERFIEFYDSRDAEAAFHALHKSSIAGKQIKLEPVDPGRMTEYYQFDNLKFLFSMCT